MLCQRDLIWPRSWQEGAMNHHLRQGGLRFINCLG